MVVRNAQGPPRLVRLHIARRVFVARKAAEIQLVFINTQPFFVRQKFKAPRNRFLFEIVAQRPVAQHFKKSTMALVPHLVDIPCTHALLHVRQPRSRGVFFPQQVGDQRMHARGCKKHCRVVLRDQGCALDYRVSLAFEKIQIHLSQFVTCQALHAKKLLFPICTTPEWRLL